MKAALLVLAIGLMAGPAFAGCSVSASGDYLVATSDPTLPVLVRHGEATQCSSVFDPAKGQVLDCGAGSKPIRNTATGVKWGGVVFKPSQSCPIVPAALAQ